MDGYYEENAKRYAEEIFSAGLSEQYQRVRPLIKGGQGYLAWRAAEGVRSVISNNKDIGWLRWNCQETFTWKSQKCSRKKSYALIFRVPANIEVGRHLVVRVTDTSVGRGLALLLQKDESVFK